MILKQKFEISSKEFDINDENKTLLFKETEKCIDVITPYFSAQEIDGYKSESQNTGAVPESSLAQKSVDTTPLPVSAPTPLAAPAPVAAADPSPFAPSFDCTKASNGQEKLVCDDRDLSKIDVDLSQAYAKAKEKTTDKDRLKKEQLEWIKFSLRACSDKTCLINTYQKRISALQ
jgi:uncharacterized protein YecT (DUF1311 family)